MIVVLHKSRSEKGHRADYRIVLTEALAEHGVRLVSKSEVASRANAAELYSTLDDFGPLFLICAVSRALIGRTTVGLFLRPGGCFKSGIKSRIKAWLFEAVCQIPNIRILTILPHSLDRRFETVSNGWIYDPQLWDLSYLGRPDPSPLPGIDKPVLQASKGREIVIAFGAQTRIKGFNQFVDLWCSSPQIRRRYQFVVAGRIFSEVAAEAELFERHGGLIFNRYFSHGEFMHFYSLASVVWSCYPPKYDQASGIFGRAVQLGVPAIVRAGSHLEKLAAELGYSVLSIPVDHQDIAIEKFLDWHPRRAPHECGIDALRKASLQTLLESLNDITGS